jgi:hypothetical protein
LISSQREYRGNRHPPFDRPVGGPVSSTNADGFARSAGRTLQDGNHLGVDATVNELTATKCAGRLRSNVRSRFAGAADARDGHIFIGAVPTRCVLAGRVARLFHAALLRPPLWISFENWGKSTPRPRSETKSPLGRFLSLLGGFAINLPPGRRQRCRSRLAGRCFPPLSLGRALAPYTKHAIMVEPKAGCLRPPNWGAWQLDANQHSYLSGTVLWPGAHQPIIGRLLDRHRGRSGNSGHKEGHARRP